MFVWIFEIWKYEILIFYVNGDSDYHGKGGLLRYLFARLLSFIIHNLNRFVQHCTEIGLSSDYFFFKRINSWLVRKKKKKERTIDGVYPPQYNNNNCNNYINNTFSENFFTRHKFIYGKITVFIIILFEIFLTWNFHIKWKSIRLVNYNVIFKCSV